MTFGIDIGTTSVSGVAIDSECRVCATVSRRHDADLSGLPSGVHAQDPHRLMTCTDEVIAELEGRVGPCADIGWTGQMHGVIGVDDRLDYVTEFVTWRDVRRFGGRIMAGWAAEKRPISRCLSICGLAIARRTGRCLTDSTFLHSWHMEEVGNLVPLDWLPDVDEKSMLGDNQAGVYGAQLLAPGCAVVNLGTSGQLSIVCDDAPTCVLPDAVEMRPYPGGRNLLCRASLIGGRAFEDLRVKRGLNWDEMNACADSDEEIAECVNKIVGDLTCGIDVSGIKSIVGIGNAITRNPVLKVAVERQFKVGCVISEISEMAAFGAAVFKQKSFV